MQFRGRRYFLSGVGGTGKTLLISTLANQLIEEFKDAIDGREEALQPTVVFCAPTGIAAYNIDGFTIHKLFGIDVEGFDYDMNADQLNVLRNQLAFCVLLVIDEVSMCSNELLAKVHIRLSQIRGSGNYFGDMNVLFVGDLMQLPPVDSKYCFEDLDEYVLSRVLKTSMKLTGFWSQMNIKYIELEQNCRQSEDQDYANLLARMRVGRILASDIELLQTRIIPKNFSSETEIEIALRIYREQSKDNPSIMAIYPLRRQVDQFNSLMLQLYYKNEMIEIPCIIAGASKNKKFIGKVEVDLQSTSDDDDTSKESDDENDIDWNDIQKRVLQRTLRKTKRSRMYRQRRFNLKKPPLFHPKVLKKTLTHNREFDPLVLARGCRIMLTRNIDTNIGLMNGAVGSLVDFVRHSKTGEIMALRIQFDHLKEEYDLHRFAFPIPGTNGKLVRKQFAVMLAFAATVHKVQGLSLQQAIIAMSTMFGKACGQAYVAFSRVTRLEGLYLVDFDINRIFVNTLALSEYNRLRATENLPPLPSSQVLVQQIQRVPILNHPPNLLLRKHRIITLGDDDEEEEDEEDAANDLDADDIGDNTQNLEVTQKSNLSYVTQPHLPGNILQLINSGAINCAVNSVVNAINACTKLRDSIINYVGNNLCSDEQRLLSQVLQGQTNDVTRLRNCFPTLLTHAYCDAADVFIQLHDTWNLDSILLLDTTVQTRYACSCVPPKRTKYNIYPSIILAARVDNSSFENVFNAWHSRTGHCNNCNSNLIYTRIVDYISPSKHYLIFEISVEHSINGNGLDIDNLVFADEKWKLFAAVQYVNQDHYVTWQRTPHDWLIIDGIRHSRAKKLLTNIALYRFLWFEKVGKASTQIVGSPIYPSNEMHTMSVPSPPLFTPDVIPLELDSDHMSPPIFASEPPPKITKAAFLQLINENAANCAINAAINILDASGTLKAFILATGGDKSSIHENLINLLLGQTNSVTDLRIQLFPKINPREWLDASEVLYSIIRELDTESIELVRHICWEERVCYCSKKTYYNSEIILHLSQFTTAQVMGKKAISISNMLLNWSSFETGNCGSCNTPIQITRTISDTSTYVFVELPSAEYMTFLPIHNDYAPTQNFGTLDEYEIIAAIQYKDNNHYVTWRRSVREWVVVDGITHYFARQLLPDLAQYRIILYKRCD